MHTTRNKIFGLVIFPLIIGACIYFVDEKVKLPSVVRNYFPDTLWSFAFANCWFIYGDNDTMSRIASLLICLLLIVAVELSQLMQVIPGTFDLVDLMVMVLACLLSFLLAYISPHSFTKTQST